MSGRLIAVVGPSGVGKDSVMEGLYAVRPGIHLVRRVITRPKDAGGEDHDPVTEQEFEDLVAHGAFALHWQAHGLRYGIPITVKYHIERGKDCFANFSRTTLLEASQTFQRFVVLNITATPETLARRLATRNRETEEQIGQRLAEANKPLPDGLDVIHLSNDGLLTETVIRATTLLQPLEV